MDASTITRIFIFIGCLFIFLGVVVWIFSKVPFIGRLPGDLVIKRETWSLYIPITTCILISVILTVLMWLFAKK